MSLSSSMLWRRMPSPSVTPNELLEILTGHTNGYYVLPEEPYDEVFPGIVLGDSTTALCLHLLRRLGITHVLNAAWGKHRNLGMVNTSAAYYRNSGIEFYGIEALDVAVFPLFEHFHPAVEFIARAVDDGGKVLVHCGEGISRSSTLVLAYLMIKRGFRVQEAVRQVVKHRNILPNQGFLLQLCQLHDRIQSGTEPPSNTSISRLPPPLQQTNSDLRTNNQSQHLKVMDNYENRARSMSPSPYRDSNNNSSRSSVSPLPERRPISQPMASSNASSRLPPLSSTSSLLSKNSSASTTPTSNTITSSNMIKSIKSNINNVSIATPTSLSRSSYLNGGEEISSNSKYRRYSPVDRTVRASSMVRERCPSPILTSRTKWSNNWSPPTHLSVSTISSPLSSSLLLSRPSSPSLSRYRRAISPCRAEIPMSSSPTPFSPRSRRCDSVDRMHTSGSSFLGDSYLSNSNRMYSNSLMSTYISRPLTIR